MGKASRKKSIKSHGERTIPPFENIPNGTGVFPSSKKFTDQPIFHLSLIIALGLLAYSNTFRSPFFFDDTTNIFWNPIIKDLDNFFFSTEAYRYNPRRFVGYLSFALNYHFGGSNVIGYHAVNLAIHILNAIFVYFLVALTFETPFFASANNHTQEDLHGLKDTGVLLLPRPIAFFSGLFFVAHPLATQSVTYIVQRYTSLAALFFLLSLLCYIKGRLLTQQRISDATLKKRTGFANPLILFVLSLLSAILAMKTKEIAFTLPLVIVLYEISFFKAPLKKKLAFLLPMLVTLAIVPLSILKTNRSLAEIIAQINAVTRVDTDLPRWDYLVTQMRAVTTYIRLIFLPINQNLDYDYQIYHSLFAPPVLASFFFLAGLLLTAIYLFRRSHSKNHSLRVISFGIFWFFITLAVESSIIPIVDVIFEHRTYLPSTGALIAITTAFFLIIQKTKPSLLTSQRAFIVFLLLAMVLAGTTYARNKVWQNDITLWEDVTEKSPNKERAHNNLGIAYQAARQTEKAIAQFERVLQLNPENAEAHNNLGIAYNSQGLENKAIEYFQTTLRLHPENAMAHNNLGSVYEAQGHLSKAIEHYQHAVRLKPDFVMGHNNLGNAYFSQGMTEKAIAEFQTALKLKPDEAEVLYNLGVAYLSKGMFHEAIICLQNALTIKPIYSEAHNNIGVAYGSQGDLDRAIKHFQTAVQQNPNNLGARNNLEIAQQQLTNSQ